MNSYKALLIGVGGTTLFLVFVGIVFLQSFLKPESSEVITLSSPQEEVSLATNTSEYSKSKIPTEDSNKTKEEIKSSAPETNSLALDQEPINCEDKETEEAKKSCTDSLASQDAIADNNSISCEDITDIDSKRYCRDKILLQTIISQKKFLDCRDIESALLNTACKEAGYAHQVSTIKTKKECDDLPGNYKKECTRKFLSSDDFHFSPHKCSVIPKDEGDDRIFCEKMAMQYTIENLLPIDCEHYPDLELFCISQQEIYADKKFYKQAIDTKNIHFCSEIKVESIQTKCKDSLLPMLAFEKDDLSFCELISSKEDQDTCLISKEKEISQKNYRQAIKQNDKSLCLKIPNIKNQKSCNEFFE